MPDPFAGGAAAPGADRDGDREGDPLPTAAAAKRVAPLIVIVIAFVVAGLFWILIGAKSGESDTADTPLMGKPAPVVKTTTLDGKAFDLQRRKGSWVVLNFFNSTCVPCIKEHPELVKFAGEQSALGLDGSEFYTVVSQGNDHGDVRAFFAKRGGSWPILLDDNASITVAFGVAKVPETWIIDPNGYVRWRAISIVTDDLLTRVLAQLKSDFNLALAR